MVSTHYNFSIHRVNIFPLIETIWQRWSGHLFRDRLNTKNILWRKNMDLDDYNCVLCNLDCEETSFHLFFKCPFSGACWSTINNDWNTNLSALDMILEAREDFGNANFREKLSHLAGLFGLQEMELFSTMVKSTSTNRRGNSNQNLD